MTTSEKIEVAETRIKELRLLINRWEMNMQKDRHSGLKLINKTNFNDDESIAA